MKDRLRVGTLAFTLATGWGSMSHAQAQTTESKSQEANVATLIVVNPRDQNSPMIMLGDSFKPGIPTKLHLDNPDGPVIDEEVPGENGTVIFQADIPKTLRGSIGIVATQKDSEGRDTYGTPARATLNSPAPAFPASILESPLSGTANQDDLILKLGLGGVGLATVAAEIKYVSRSRKRGFIPSFGKRRIKKVR